MFKILLNRSVVERATDPVFDGYLDYVDGSTYETEDGVNKAAYELEVTLDSFGVPFSEENYIITTVGSSDTTVGSSNTTVGKSDA